MILRLAEKKDILISFTRIMAHKENITTYAS